MEENLRLKIDWASLTVEGKFTVFAFFYFVFEGNIPSTSPRGAYIWRGLYMEGLIFGILRYIVGKSVLRLYHSIFIGWKCKGKSRFYLRRGFTFSIYSSTRLQTSVDCKTVGFFRQNRFCKDAKQSEVRFLREAREPHRFHPFSIPLSFDSSAGARVLNLGEIRRGCLRSKTLGTRVKIA